MSDHLSQSVTDLGLCDALTPEGRCPGRLEAVGEVGVLIEARCPVCGADAALPVRKTTEEPAEDGEERWWQQW